MRRSIQLAEVKLIHRPDSSSSQGLISLSYARSTGSITTSLKPRKVCRGACPLFRSRISQVKPDNLSKSGFSARLRKTDD